MIRFSEEKVLLLHQMIIGETGGSPELRDIGLLDSALEGCYQTFGGVELYPTKEEKGARLGYSLIANSAVITQVPALMFFALPVQRLITT